VIALYYLHVFTGSWMDLPSSCYRTLARNIDGCCISGGRAQIGVSM
jgi:hypothetical protein